MGLQVEVVLGQQRIAAVAAAGSPVAPEQLKADAVAAVAVASCLRILGLVVQEAALALRPEHLILQTLVMEMVMAKDTSQILVMETELASVKETSKWLALVVALAMALDEAPAAARDAHRASSLLSLVQCLRGLWSSTFAGACSHQEGRGVVPDLR